MAHTKSGGSTKLGRDSASKRLGVKRQNGQTVRGTKYLAGKNVLRASDDTLYASKNGVVKFLSKKKIRFDGNSRYAKIIAIV